MKRILAFVVAIGLAYAAHAADPPKTNPGWEKLKTLVGEWEGTIGEGHGTVTVTYRLVSNGSTLMETMDVPDHTHTMITMYAPDAPNDRIVATHYCAAGNQPRMAARELKGDSLDFDFLDATNARDGEDLMRALVVKFQDADHFQQLWTSREGGRDHTGTFAYARRR